jgi:arylformamidase
MLQLSEEIVCAESPLFNLPNSGTPLIASVGGNESAEFKRQSTEYIAAWQAAGFARQYSEQPGKNHYTAIEGFLDKNSALCTRRSGHSSKTVSVFD